MKNIEKIIRNPADYFAAPQDVVVDKHFSLAEKIRILRSWEYDARELEVAEEENMPSDKPDLLRRVKKALYELGEQEHSHDSTGTKHGGG